MLQARLAVGWAVLWLGLSGCSAPAPTSSGQTPLRWGSDAEGGMPYIFKDPKNPEQNVGFEVELIEAISKELGRPIVHKQYGFPELTLGLERGDFDIGMNGIELTPDRQARLTLSRPYYYYKLRLAVRADEDRIQSLEDIKRLKLTVGTLSDTAASRLLEQEGIKTNIYDGQFEPYRDLEFGGVDAVLMDVPIAQYCGKPNPKLKLVGQPFARGAYVAIFRKDAAGLALQQQFDQALDNLQRSGELERIYRKWDIYDDDVVPAAGDAPLIDVPPVSLGFTIAQYLPLLLDGAKMTVFLSITSMALAMALGLPLALGRLYGPFPVRLFATLYVEFFRGVPLLLLLYVIYYGSPALLEYFHIDWKPGPLLCAIVGLGMNYAAYEAEIYRAGISAIPVGQWEAAASLGMTKAQTFRRIILPQTWRLILPPVTNDFVAMFKDTSLVSVITVTELTRQYYFLSKSSMQYFEIGLATAILYLMMSVPLGYLSRWMEARLAKG